jgi:hypothetical protein
MAYTKFTLKVTFNINITSMSKNKLTWKLPPWKGGKGGRPFEFGQELHEEGGQGGKISIVPI